MLEQLVDERTRDVHLAGIHAAFQQLPKDRRVARGVGRGRGTLHSPQQAWTRVEIGHVFEQRPKPSAMGSHVVQMLFVRVGYEAPPRAFQ